MLEVYGDLFELLSKYDSFCITTNGCLNSKGEAVMGKGIALQAARLLPDLPRKLGSALRRSGNRVFIFEEYVNGQKVYVYTFPTKNNWREPSDIQLIKRSCSQLMALIASNERVLLPRPGCGCGELNWLNVKKEIAPLLDDRVTIVTWRKP